LEEAKIPHKKFFIDLKNKPEWYAPKINPASKVRCLQLRLRELREFMEIYVC